MSTHRSYLSKNNTIVSESTVNTAKNPVTQLFYGKNVSDKCKFTGLSGDTCNGSTGFTPTVVNGFSRLIFDLDLTDLKSKVGNCCLSLDGNSVVHTLKMTNTSNFDDKLLNDYVLVDGSRRATSFDLMLFKVTGNTWSEGVGYDYSTPNHMFGPEFDIDYSIRPSNWFSSTTLSPWSIPGTYSNTTPSSYTVLATQSFDNGNENISFSSTLLTNEINHMLTGSTSSTTGVTYGVSFIPAFESLTGLTTAYSVGFFSRYTQTFYEPFLETSYDDTIDDNRNDFTVNKSSRLFIYVYDNGTPVCLDVLPTVSINDCNGSLVITKTASKLTCGVYYIDLTLTTLSQASPVQYEDVWSGIIISGIPQPNITNDFIIHDNAYSIGTEAGVPKVFGYSVSGIKEDEKIKNGDTRKVFVSTRVPYTVSKEVLVDTLSYRLYVTEGKTQVEVIPWTPINKTSTKNYFLMDTSWMIPNEYFLDIKAVSNQQIDTYRKAIKFQIINEK
jgi:hypothetical protein